MLKRSLPMLLFSVLLLSGCNSGAADPAPVITCPPDPDQLPVLMMAEDTLYQHDIGTLDSSIKIEDSQILGYITTSYANTMPTQNGEACGVPEGAPYARCPLEEYPEGMVVRMPGQIADTWWIFLPENQVS